MKVSSTLKFMTFLYMYITFGAKVPNKYFENGSYANISLIRIFCRKVILLENSLCTVSNPNDISWIGK